LSDDRLDIFFKLFDYPRKSTREDRTQRFLTTTLPEILNFNSQAYNRNLMDILNVLNSGSPDQVNHFKHPRLPQVFQRPPGAQPSFRLLLTSPVHIDHSTGSDRLTERTVIGRFLTVAGQPPSRGSVTIDGADLLPVNFGELDSVFLLNNGERKTKKSLILVDNL
jgi:hypothetical protein